MSETLLRTKLFVPPLRPNLVERPQLVKHLNESLEPGHKLTLISAPAGFGKTTVAREWLESLFSKHRAGRSAPIRSSWLSLDENDNDLTRFLTYIITALTAAEDSETGFGKGALTMLQSAQPLQVEVVLTSLVNDVALVSDRVIHVLDDYHLIELPAVHEAVTFLLENMPPQMHLVIVTRDDPHLPLARLRARGQLVELRAADLRFSAAEASQFLQHVMGLDLSPAELAALESRTEGWIAGLQLAAIALQGRDDATELIKTFTGSHRFVLDYLMEEVLREQSEDVQDFLLQTSILDRFTAPLCVALTGVEDGQVILQDLDHSNLFVVPLDGERRWYRYHHLFADLLRWRLRQSHPQEVTILHLKAAAWFTQQGMYREAISHAMAGGNYQGAADLIEAIAVDIVQEGKHSDVIRWINKLPDQLVKERAYLCVLHAWALQLSGQFEETEDRLQDAERCLAKQLPAGEDGGIVLGMINSHRAYLTFFKGDHEQTASYALQALEQLPPTVSLIRAQTALYLGVAYRYQGRLQAALDVYRETLPVAQRVGGSSTVMLCYLGLAELYCETAQLHRARTLLEEALEFTRQQAGRPDMPFAGYVYVTIGRILRQWNQLDEAYRFTTKGMALVRDWKVPEIVGLSCIEWAYIHLALDHADEARSAIQEAMQISESYSPWSAKLVAAHRAKIDLALNDMDSAVRWSQANDLDLDGDFAFNREIEYFSLARLLIAQERLDEAHSLVQRLRGVAQEIGKKQTELEALILLALVFSARGDEEGAVIHLQQAAAIGEAEGYVRVFLDEGRSMIKLLNDALQRNVFPDYMRRLLSAFPADQLAPAERVVPTPDQSQLIEPLSERELEILQLVAKGLTNRQIAERLYLSLNTVKVHTRNIYGKLGVHSRTQAVSTARALDIIPLDI